ncbi:MAG TPA: hypothetical protein VMS21_10435 [Methylomirabilota bacterium]|nr:hypothetical protein [Methylomirabilota bacterium]
MKVANGCYHFRLRHQEHPAFVSLLRLFPVLPPDFQPLSKSADPAETEADQKLLEEAMRSQKAGLKSEVEKLLQDGDRLRKTPEGWELALEGPQLEWFLQVVNEIRVGSWRHLGSPDPLRHLRIEINETSLHHLWAMGMCDRIQSAVLEALRG